MTSDNLTLTDRRNEDRRAEIAHRAYELYLERGCVDGQDLDDWLTAERESLEKEIAGQTSPTSAGDDTGDISRTQTAASGNA
jgi:hypothetical protein